MAECHTVRALCGLVGHDLYSPENTVLLQASTVAPKLTRYADNNNVGPPGASLTTAHNGDRNTGGACNRGDHSISEWSGTPVIGETRVLVTGTGVHGLPNAKLIEADDVILVDKGTGIGGTWNHCQYPGLRLHGLSADYRFPEMANSDTDIRSTAPKVLEYLQNYFDSFSHKVSLYLHTELISIREVEAEGTPLFSCLLLQSRERIECLFTHVVLATGFNVSGKPRMPFPGKIQDIVHSSQVNSKLLRDANKIVVVGAGKSAMDLLISITKS
jgi:cation diffusion facilitator CzcD-associated flavoprotein CzcO